MISRELLERAESIQFATELNVVSSERLFESALRHHPLVTDLFGHLTDVESREQLAVRLADLLYRDIDPRYEHPHDVAIAVYLRLLDVSDPQLGGLAAATAVRQPNLWWARSVAMEILQGSRTHAREVSTETTGDVSNTQIVANAGTQVTWVASPMLMNGVLMRSVTKRNQGVAHTPVPSVTYFQAA